MQQMMSSEKILHLLVRQNLADPADSLEKMAGDGSDRTFFRVLRSGEAGLVVVLPNYGKDWGMAEARAGFYIGRHLFAHDVPVPRIHLFDEESGILVFEDLGDCLLYDQVIDMGGDDPEVLARYKETVAALARLQTWGVEDFNAAHCWDTPVYDRKLMLERESGYFRQALCVSALGLDKLPVSLQVEFNAIADEATRQPATYLLHRDFQSRNIMLVEGGIKIIDFQGARMGPLAYDLASLLIDPYAGLDRDVQEQLMEHYLRAVGEYIDINRDFFREGYYYLSLQRNLQILGAFAFLANQRGKEFFRPFLRPAADNLAARLKEGAGRQFPALTALTDIIRERLTAC